jgi:hypothetical protein
MLKAAIKHAAGEDQVRQRSVPAEVTQKYIEKLEDLKDEIKEVMQEEKEEKQVPTPLSPLCQSPTALTRLICSFAGRKWN